MSICLSQEKTAMDRFAIDVNLRSPFANIGAPRHSEKFGGAVLVANSSVSLIARAINVAQIVVSVIQAIAVNVVNLTKRERAINVKPRKPIGSVQFPSKTDVSVAFGVNAPCQVSRLAPTELSGFGVVVNGTYKAGMVHCWIVQAAVMK